MKSPGSPSVIFPLPRPRSIADRVLNLVIYRPLISWPRLVKALGRHCVGPDVRIQLEGRADVSLSVDVPEDLARAVIDLIDEGAINLAYGATGDYSEPPGLTLDSLDRVPPAAGEGVLWTTALIPSWMAGPSFLENGIRPALAVAETVRA